MGKNQSKLTPEQLVDLQKSTYCEYQLPLPKVVVLLFLNT